MKNNMIQDIKAAAGVFIDMRKAREAGRDIQIEKVETVQIPLIDCGPSLIHTIEGHVLINGDQDVYRTVKDAFGNLSYEERRKMLNVPKSGEFIERLYFWENLLRPVLMDKQRHTAMMSILHWYIHIKAMRIGKGGAV